MALQVAPSATGLLLTPAGLGSAAPAQVARLGAEQPSFATRRSKLQGTLWVSAAAGLVGSSRKAKARARAARKASFDPRNSIGVLEPLGYWDPVGLMKDGVGRWKDEETFNTYRQAELKHGRLAMVALTGMFAAANTRFQFSEFEYGPDGFGALEGEAAAGVGVIFLLAGLIEVQVPKGDFQDPLGFCPSGWGYTEDMRSKELAHGRLAMSTVFTLWLFDYGAGIRPSDLWQQSDSGIILKVAAAFLVLAWSPYLFGLNATYSDNSGANNTVKVSNKDAEVESFFGKPSVVKVVEAPASSLSGFDPTNSIGVLDPFGYWDPVGLMKDGSGNWKDEETFNSYRQAELKHGRLAMVALTGFFAASKARFPLDEFKDSPDGLAALGSEAAGGIGIIFLFAAFIEVQVPKGDFKDPLGFGNASGFGYTDDMRNKELAHGRLAMSAVLALAFYDFYGGRAPSDIFNQPTSKVAVLGFAAIVLVWSQYLTKDRDNSDWAKSLGSTPAPTAIAASSTVTGQGAATAALPAGVTYTNDAGQPRFAPR